MNDPHTNIPSYADTLGDAPSYAYTVADLPSYADTCPELPIADDAPDFDPTADPEVNTVIRLKGDRTYTRTPSRRLYHDYRANPDAYRHLDHLPADGESLHGVISGKYALWELVPALITKTGQPIQDLTIATLSYSKANAADLLGLLDDGHVKRVALLISYYFKSTSRPIYDSLVPQLRERGHPVLAMRTHCKIILAHMADGTKYVAESSANLRSSVNVEQFVLTRDGGLYDFHRGWIAGELMHGEELGDSSKELKELSETQDHKQPAERRQ